MQAPKKSGNSFHRSPLYVFIQKKFPEYQTERTLVDVYRLAEAIGVSHEALYAMFRKRSLNSDQAKRFVELSKQGDRTEKQHITMYDLVQFMG